MMTSSLKVLQIKNFKVTTIREQNFNSSNELENVGKFVAPKYIVKTLR